MKKHLTRIFTVMICLAVVMSFSTTQVNAASKKPGKVKASSIKYLGIDSNTSTMAFKWKKVKGAKGYQVRVIDAKSYKESGTVVQYLNGNCKKNTITLNGSSLESEKAYQLQVRAFKKKGKRKVYGKWSTGKVSFAAKVPSKGYRPAIPFKPVITATPLSATIKVGETASFLINMKGVNAWNMDCSASGSLSAPGIEFRVEDGPGAFDETVYAKGLMESTGYIFVYDTKYEDVNAFISITVVDPDADPDVKPYIDPDYNTSISFDKSYIAINQGETATLEVYTDKGTEIVTLNYTAIDFKWGDWFGDNNKNRYAYITGIEKGVTIISLYDLYNQSVTAVIPVIVR